MPSYFCEKEIILGNFNIFDFFNAVNNNPAAKNALNKILSGNNGGQDAAVKAAGKKERLRPNANKPAAPQDKNNANGINGKSFKNGDIPGAKTANPSQKPFRYSDKSLTEIIRRHDEISKQISAREAGEAAMLTAKEKTPLTFPENKN